MPKISVEVPQRGLDARRSGVEVAPRVVEASERLQKEIRRNSLGGGGSG